MLIQKFDDMSTVKTNAVSDIKVINPRYILLESDICYDWDDYGVWGAVLFDLNEDRISTTKYGHGVPLDTSDTISLEEAIERNLVTYEHLIDVMVDSLGIGWGHCDWSTLGEHRSINKPFDIPVKIVGGRKGKGVEGRLMCVYTEPVRYGLGAYRNDYYVKPVILNPKTNEFIVVNSTGYLEFPESFIKEYNIKTREVIENTRDNVYRLAHAWAYGLSYSSCDTHNYRRLIANYSGTVLSDLNEISEPTKAAIEIYNAEEERKRAEHKAAEMAKIIEWVKTHTDKEGDEIEVLAERIYNKYH